MFLYFSLFFLLVIVANLEVLSNNKIFSHKSLVLLLMIFFTLSFIRWETGTDWGSYYETFQRIKIPWETLVDDYSGFELGFMLLYNVARTFSNSYTMMLFIEAMILYVCVYCSIKSQSIYPILSLLVYYSMSFAGIFFVRQNIAMAILLCGLKYICERKFLPFLVIVILASLIHRTAVIFIIAYFIFYRYYSIKSIILIICVATSFGICLSQFVLTFLGGLGWGIISAKVDAYLNLGAEDNSTTFSTMGILLRGLINRAFLIAIYFFMLNKKRKNDRILNGLINLNILGIILYVVLTPIAFSLGRITAYFDILQIFIIPYLFAGQSLKTKYNLLFLLSFYLAFRLYTAIAAYPGAYIPYKTILGEGM